jgi:thiamine pyrophosphokinase
MRSVVFANGEIKSLKMIKSVLLPDDRIVAADGGLRHVRALGIIPDLIIGDLDSITFDDKVWLNQEKVEIIKFPREKDQTDLELALLSAAEAGSESIVVVGALGGRTDQTLANLFLMLMPELVEIKIWFEDGQDEVFLVQKTTKIKGKAGDTVSLLPLLGAARGVTTKGLKFPLNDGTLFPERSRGVSNVMKTEEASVSVKTGALLCIHTRDSSRKNWS